MKVSKLKLNPSNPRQIKSEKLELLKRSITDFEKMMTLRPMVVDEQNVVLGGNMRLQAIKALGMKEIPDEWIKKAEGLTEEEKKEFVIKDNNSFGEYDWDVIANQWDDLPLHDWGLELPTDWADIVTVSPKEEDESLVASTISKAKELQKKWKTAENQMWKLGNHLLICADSTKKEDVERLMQGEKADIGMHDPPYGIDAPNMTLGTGKKEFVREDFDKTTPLVINLLSLSNICAIWGGNYFADQLPVTNDWLCWHKKNDGLSFSEFELAWTNSGKNTRHLSHHWSGEEKNHPTQKPLPVIKWALELFEGKTVIDCYAGSGTTLIACEQLNRKARCCEISPEYVAVCLERFLNYSGTQPQLLD